MDGYGKITYEDGEIYEGNWVMGKKEGSGTLKTKEGYLQSGQWVQDSFKCENDETPQPQEDM